MKKIKKTSEESVAGTGLKANFPASGKQFPIVVEPDAFAASLKKGKEVALAIPLKAYPDYISLLIKLTGGKIPSLGLVCVGCTARLSESTSFMTALTGFLDSENFASMVGGNPEYIAAARAGQCPNCKETHALLIHSHGEF